MKICFAGDLFLGGDAQGKLTVESVESESFRNADLRIVNLEQAISDADQIADKCTLYTNSSSVNQLQELAIDAVCLAHNHIQDKGLKGIGETVRHLESRKIKCFGAGETLKSARQPCWITDDLAIFGYCEFGKPYLNQIEVATQEKPGVSPLCYENILQDLDCLENDQKAILFIHWGREHVFFPPYNDIQIARNLLEHDRVALIVGGHAHRLQGVVRHNGKRAYMSVGNFLFPNFFISPPTQICYPDKIPERVDVTRQYHSVDRITLKKWSWINRVSLLVEYDSEAGAVNHNFLMQKDNTPCVTTLSGWNRLFVQCLFNILTTLYLFPAFVYKTFDLISIAFMRCSWRSRILLFRIKQRGVRGVFKYLRQKFGMG